ncbi:O-antigen ligase family protein [Desulfobulbus oligotrophicus]|uniref:O-antigen ligase family protein n=1 Tax=Desulfobulbus oligotrophicus TaxID=1909699 RepID=A0A7T6APS5_9BACT|nr:O-antigen ligase family protein [Desulfobulbus oligotrophicus]QQG64700.1 O-antigen ligase family protein [Desulfobulbus oligotrophicus]
MSTARYQPNRLWVYLTCIYILTWYLQLGLRVGLLGTIRFEFCLGAILSLAAFSTYFSIPEKNSPLFGPVLFLLGIFTCYTLFSHDFSHSWNIYFDRVVKFAMLAVFLSVFVRTPWALKMVVGAFLLAMLKLGQEGFVGWVTGGQVWQNQGIMRLHGSTPMYGHPNSFSGMAVGCLPFIYFLFPTVARIWKCALLLLLAFCAVIIIFTGSRTGYVATIGLGLVFFVLSPGKAKWRYFILAGLIGAVTLAFAPDEYKERFESIFTMQEREGASSETRMEIIHDAVDVYLAYPLGVGVGAFPLVRMEMFGRFQDTHNLYLELLTNLGPVGVIAFFMVIYQIFTVNKQIQKRLLGCRSPDQQFVAAVSKAVVAFIWARLFLGLFGMDTYEIYWWFAIGLSGAMWTIVQLGTTENTVSDHAIL